MFPQSAQRHLCQVNSVVKKEKPVNSTTADMEALLCFFSIVGIFSRSMEMCCDSPGANDSGRKAPVRKA